MRRHWWWIGAASPSKKKYVPQGRIPLGMARVGSVFKLDEPQDKRRFRGLFRLQAPDGDYVVALTPPYGGPQSYLVIFPTDSTIIWEL